MSKKLLETKLLKEEIEFMKKLLSVILLILFVALLCVSCEDEESTSSSQEHVHVEEIVPRKEATCLENGYTEWKKCAECDEALTSPETLLASHTEEIIPRKEATCLENGYTEWKKCSKCNEALTTPETLLASHTEQTIPSVAPSVEKTGSTEGKKCSVCNEILLQPKDITLLGIEIDATDSSKGNVSCELIFDGLSGSFSIYYADENKQKLPYFNAITTVSVDNNTVELDGLILPSGCEYILADGDSDYDYFVEIPNEYLLGEKNYTYTSLSDVHVNKGLYLMGALDFLDAYGEIDFVAISGDICDGSEKDLLVFNGIIQGRDYKVYTTSGNHDENSIKSGLWEKHINRVKNTDNEVFDVGENGFDFVYIPEKNPDSVFVFLCQTSWYYSKNPDPEQYTLLTAEQLTWLEGVLEKYKDKTVLLYFHTFLSAPDGTQESSVGNLRNPGGYAYDLPFSYGAADEVAFRALMKKYKNVVYFSGHSHWMFELEIYNENLNVSNFDGEYCYMVHNPSVCEPRWISESSSSRQSMMGKNSEGWIVELYEDTMILIPVDFINEVFYTEYIKIIPLS